jgi:hypothetical protein
MVFGCGTIPIALAYHRGLYYTKLACQYRNLQHYIKSLCNRFRKLIIKLVGDLAFSAAKFKQEETHRLYKYEYSKSR